MKKFPKILSLFVTNISTQGLLTALPFAGIIVSLFCIQQIFPVSLLNNLIIWGDQTHLIVNFPAIFLFYLSLFTLITGSYILILKKNFQLTNAPLVLILILIFIIGVFSYPIVYDTVYFFIGNYISSRLHINPYLGTNLFVNDWNLPFIQIPIPHNYPYGPIWFLLTQVLFAISQDNLIIYNLLVKLLIFCVIYYALTRVDSQLRSKLFIYIILNPLVLYFVVFSNHIEVVLALFYIFTIMLVEKRLFVQSLVLTIFTILIKPSSSILLLLVIPKYLLNIKILPQNTPRIRSVVIIVISLSVYLFCNILLMLMIPGLYEFISNEALVYGLNGFIAFLWLWISGDFLGTNPYIFFKVILLMTLIILLFFSLLNYIQNKWTGFKTLFYISILNIYLLGIAVRPWYLIIPLILSIFVDRKVYFKSAYATILTMLGFISYTVGFYFTGKAGEHQLAYIISSLIFYILPLGLFASEMFFSDKKFDLHNSTTLDIFNKPPDRQICPN